MTLSLLVLLFPGLGLFLGFCRGCWRHDRGGVFGGFGGGAGIVDGAIVVGANGEGGSYALAVNDDGGFGGFAG